MKTEDTKDIFALLEIVIKSYLNATQLSDALDDIRYGFDVNKWRVVQDRDTGQKIGRNSAMKS